MTDFDLGAEVGGFLTIGTPAGERLLVQVHGLESDVRDDVRVAVDLGGLGGAVDDAVQSASIAIKIPYVTGGGAVIGTLDGDRIGPISGHGFTDGSIAVASDAEVRAFVEYAIGSSAALSVGRLSRASAEARLKASGFARHTFLCGQSGSGKTYSMGVLLERLLLETDLPLCIIDPNSDYVGLGTMRSRAEVNKFRPSPLSKSEYDALAAAYRAKANVLVASANGGDFPLRIHLSDLTLEEQALTLGLDPVVDANEFAAYVAATRAVAVDRYAVEHVEAVLLGRFDEASRRVAQRIANLGVATWSIWAPPDEDSLVHRVQGARAVVFDTGSLSDPRERSLLALALLGRLRMRPDRSAISVVIDEAHNVCSPDAQSALERAVAAHTVWIAGEGRKFGIYMILATQRPQKVHRNVISQCDNLLLMRVNSVTDLGELASVFSHVPPTMVAEARSFQLGEMLAAGPIAPTPIRLRTGERWSPEGGADLPTTWAKGRPT